MRGIALALWLALAPVAALAQGSDVSNPQTNATALTTGTLPAARMPALTGDTTSSAGTVATTTTKINGVDQTTAWTAFTSNMACGNNALTVTSATQKTIGKSVLWEIDVTLNATIGTCTSVLTFSMPNGTSNTAGGGGGGEPGVSGKGVSCYVVTAGTTYNCRLSDVANFGASAHIIASGVYEKQ